MKKSIILFLCISLSSAMVFYCHQAYAMSFTDSDLIDNATGMNTDINCNQDFSWSHNSISVPDGYSIDSVQVTIYAYDVDNPASYNQDEIEAVGREEVDYIYAYDDGEKVLVGKLVGGNGYSYSTFTLGSNFYDDIENGLVLYVDSDALGTTPYWVMQVGSSEITVVASSSVPIPGAFWLLGSGLVGLMGISRKSRKG
jgi:hypothetical protein